MSMGEIIEIDGNAFGDSIDIAARIERLAPAGSVWMNSMLYVAVRSRSEFGFEYVGPFSLKKIAEPADVYRVYDGPAAVTLRPANRERLAEAAIPERGHPAPGKKPSIAVLPFQNQPGQGEHDFFADGVTEDIVRNLTRFRGLDAIARGSSFAFRGSALPLAEPDMQLGARYIVRGSVRPAGSRVRVSVAPTTRSRSTRSGRSATTGRWRTSLPSRLDHRARRGGNGRTGGDGRAGTPDGAAAPQHGRVRPGAAQSGKDAGVHRAGNVWQKTDRASTSALKGQTRPSMQLQLKQGAHRLAVARATWPRPAAAPCDDGA
jgi:TolB-like protein